MYPSMKPFQVDVENIQHLAPDIAGRLVRRPEDLPNQIEQSIELYKNNVLVPLEVHIIINQHTYTYICVIFIIPELYYRTQQTIFD